MYDNEKYEKMRDSGFSLFYMFINVGAIFAPLAAVGMRNGWLSSQGFLYDPDLPELCHGFLRNSLSPEATARFQELAATVSKNGAPTDMTAFADRYLGAFATGFHFAFGIAIFAMLISLVIYLANKRKLPDPRKLTASGATSDPHTVRMAAAEVKKRIWALIAVYAVVIFFWFSFHQNGLTLTFFAKDYTLLKIGSLDLSAEIFQSMNPFFVVFLTPAVLAFFGWMRANGREPSTPAKIAIGMGIAATAYLVMMLGSLNLPSAAEVEAMGGLPDSESVTPFLLIGTYLILTIAELFISPLGISFVSKVAPPQYQGLMQGGWLGATAIGNQLLFIGAVLYDPDLAHLGNVRGRLPDLDDRDVLDVEMAEPDHQTIEFKLPNNLKLRTHENDKVFVAAARHSADSAALRAMGTERGGRLPADCCHRPPGCLVCPGG